MEPEDRSNHGVGVRNMMRKLEEHDKHNLKEHEHPSWGKGKGNKGGDVK